MPSLTDQPAANKNKISEVPRSPARHATGIKSACFTPLSFFHRNLDLEYTQLRCFALITVETLGANRPSVEIPYQQFADTFQVSTEWIANAICQLQESGMIQVGRSERGRPTYAIREEYIQEAKNAGRQTVRGKCPNCHAIGEFSTEFIPTPHQALRKLGGCVNSATYRVVMVVIRHTLKWGKESRCVEVEPSELALDDFKRVTGLESREITNGLTTAVKLGLIGRELRSGKPSLFWAIPEKFGALEQREARTVVRPLREKKEKTPSPEKEEIGKEDEPTRADESRPFLYGRCLKCKHLVEVEPVTEEEFAAAPTENASPPPKRAGPGRETNVKNKWEGVKRSAWDMYVAK